MCVYANGSIVFYPVDQNIGNFNGCGNIDWVNTKNQHFLWHRQATPGGPFRQLDPASISDISQHLDLYNGQLSSNFSLEGTPVQVSTVVDDATDSVSVSYTTKPSLNLTVQLAFCTTSDGSSACVWDLPQYHNTNVLATTSSPDSRSGRIDLGRSQDFDTYSTSCTYKIASGSGVQISSEQTGQHSFVFRLSSTNAAVLDEEVRTEITCRFQLACCVGVTPPKGIASLVHEPVPTFEQVNSNTVSMWTKFWSKSAMVDFSPAFDVDSRAKELERRVILSLYQLRAQESGDMPPQESGLLYNSWTGKTVFWSYQSA